MKSCQHIGLILVVLSVVIVILVTLNTKTFNMKYTYTESADQPATTGKEFKGKKIRTFSKESQFKNPDPIAFIKKSDPIASTFFEQQESLATLRCNKWGVMTTIYSPPTEAVRRFLFMSDWCCVVVGDFNKPVDFTFESTLGENIIFLSSDDQKELGIDFVDSLPWNSFARKNVGYLFAIARGAKVIWDFDDDNFLKFWIDGAAIDKSLDINFYTNMSSKYTVDVAEPELENLDTLVFNPYPLLGSPSPLAWPRGFPLNEINNKAWTTATMNTIENVKIGSFAVIQSLADYQPDVDAIFRMTQKTPFVFKKPSDGYKQGMVLKIPNHLQVPYNAQATLHFYDAFWALLLPSSVYGRVSDIWRSYMGQALFKSLNLSVGFLPRPLVVQERNQHSYEADFNAEIPLYVQGKALISHIAKNYLQSQKEITNLPEAIEQLWIDLYEHGYIEISDVYLVQKWIKALKSINYIFPGTDQFHSPVTSKLLKVGKTLKQASLKVNSNLPIKSYKCKNEIPQLTFAATDLHSGPRLDLPTLLTHLGQNFILMGSKGYDPNYPDVFKNNYNVKSYFNLSATLNTYRDHSYNLTLDEISNNYNYFKNDEVIKKIDAFICNFPASMCQLWMPFNKSIIFLPAHRYNLGRCSPSEWLKLDSDVKILASSNKHVVGAMSRYDAEYLRYYTGISVNILSSFGGYYTFGNSYNPGRNEFLIVSDVNAKAYIKSVTDTLSPQKKAVYFHDLYPFYTQKDLTNHPAIIMLPYSVMSYKLTEFYALAVPLFIPSPKFFIAKNGMGCDRTSTTGPYCHQLPDLEKLVRPDLNSGFSSHPYSPNEEFQQDSEAEMYWMQYADFYEWPYIQHYDSYQHLKFILNEVDLKDISIKMQEELQIRGNVLNTKWCNIIENLHNAT